MRHFVVLSLVLANASVFPHFPKGTQTPSLPVHQYEMDMRTKNLDDVLQMYTPDAVFADPTGNTFATPEARRKLYETVFATYDSDLVLSRTGLKIKGDITKAGATVVETDTYRENLLTRATKTVAVLCGTSVSSWVRSDDGRWLMTNQTWTSSPCTDAPANDASAK